MRQTHRTLWLIALYLGSGMAVLWPGTQPGNKKVPGGAWTDVWNSLWSMDFAHQSVLAGTLPWHTTALGHPDGGSVLLPDFWGALFAVPMVGLLGVAGAYTAWLVIQLAGAGLMSHLFCAEWLQHHGHSRIEADRASLVAGVSFLASPGLLAGAQCGTTEAVAGGWLAGAVWAVWRALIQPARERSLVAGVALAAATLAGWYTAVVAFVFAGCMSIAHIRQRGAIAATPLSLGLLFAAPFALWTHGVHSDPSHLATRVPEVLDAIRASFGAATPLGMIWPVDVADIAIGSPGDAGEGYLHTGYLGLSLLLASVLGLRQMGRARLAIPLAGLVCAILSWGPGTSGLLPYGLIDDLPGATNLSLVWRLSVGTALAISFLAAAATRGRWRWVLGLLILFVIEITTFSPLKNGVASSSVKPPQAFNALNGAQPGALITLPIQHADLWLQTIHRQPVTGNINIRRSARAHEWVSQALSDDWKKSSINAKEIGIRYIAVRQSETLRASPERVIAHRLETETDRLARQGRWTIYALW